MFLDSTDTLSLLRMKAALKRNSAQLNLIAKKCSPCDVFGNPVNQEIVEKIVNLMTVTYEFIELLSLPLSEEDKKIDRTFYLALHSAATESMKEIQVEIPRLIATYLETFPAHARAGVIFMTNSIMQNSLDCSSIVQDLMMSQKNSLVPEIHKRRWFSRH